MPTDLHIALQVDAHEVESSGPLLQALCESRANRGPEPRAAPRQLSQRRPHELFEGHHRRDRISRQAEYERAATRFESTKGERIARLHVHSPEDQRATELLENPSDEISIADRYTGGTDEHVCAKPRPQPSLDVVRRISCDAQIEGFRADLQALRGDRI